MAESFFVRVKLVTLLVLICLALPFAKAQNNKTQRINTQIFEKSQEDQLSFVDRVKSVREIAEVWEVSFEQTRGVFSLSQNPQLQRVFVDAQKDKLPVRVVADPDSREVQSAQILASQEGKSGSGMGAGSQSPNRNSQGQNSNRSRGGSDSQPSRTDEAGPVR